MMKERDDIFILPFILINKILNIPQVSFVSLSPVIMKQKMVYKRREGEGGIKYYYHHEKCYFVERSIATYSQCISSVHNMRKMYMLCKEGEEACFLTNFVIQRDLFCYFYIEYVS